VFCHHVSTVIEEDEDEATSIYSEYGSSPINFGEFSDALSNALSSEMEDEG